MRLSIFIDEDHSRKILASLGLPLSEFAVGAMKQTANPARYMFNREKMYSDVSNLRLFKKCEQIELADAILMPTDYSHAKKRAPELLRHYLNLSERLSKPLIVSSLGDTTQDIPGKRQSHLELASIVGQQMSMRFFALPLLMTS